MTKIRNNYNTHNTIKNQFETKLKFFTSGFSIFSCLKAMNELLINYKIISVHSFTLFNIG